MAKKSKKPTIGIAPTDEASTFFERLHKTFPARIRSASDKEALRKYLAGFDDETLRRILRRSLINLIQHPASEKRQPRGSKNRDRKKAARPGQRRR